MGRWTDGIELLKASWAVLQKDKELLVLPVISGACAIVVIGLFGYPAIRIIQSASEPLVTAENDSIPVTAWILLSAVYLLTSFIGIFFNCALVHGANERMLGGDPTVGSAIKGAQRHIGKIFAWSLISALVSMIIRQIQERAGILGGLLGFLAGAAWAVVTFLVLPVLVIEGLGPVDALKRSTELIKRKWGEGLTGHLGLSIIGFVIIVCIAVFVGASSMAGLLVLTLPLGILAAVATLVVISALSVIFQTALYHHAVGNPVEGFAPALLNSAFSTKNGAVRPRPVSPIPPRPGYPGSTTYPDSMQAPLRPFDAAGATPPPSSGPAVDFSEPQDWSSLPEEWTNPDQH